jgi:hypothetical protein
MGLGSRAFDQQIRGLTPPQVRKSNHQDCGIKRPLTINDVAYELVRIIDALESPGLSIEPMSA